MDDWIYEWFDKIGKRTDQIKITHNPKPMETEAFQTVVKTDEFFLKISVVNGLIDFCSKEDESELAKEFFKFIDNKVDNMFKYERFWGG